MLDSENISLDLPIDAWVAEVKSDPIAHRNRQVTHILLAAIGMTKGLHDTMVLKGGTLMMLAFGSPRGTQDVDFSVSATPEPFTEQLSTTLDPALQRAAAQLGYLDIVCRVQKLKKMPRPATFENDIGAALKITIGHARRDTNEETRLAARQAPRALQVDLSFNEPMLHSTHAQLGRPAVTIRAYTPEDVIGEKLRALIQQPIRNRQRRQDVYDIAWLLEAHDPDALTRQRIFESMIGKAEARDLTLSVDSFDDPEIKRRAEMDWNTLQLEIGDLPPFESLFERVRAFYRSLPWNQKK